MQPIFIEAFPTIQRVANEALGERQHDFIISDETPDDWGTVFKVSGWDLSARAMGKKRVTIGHPPANSTDPNVVIGIGDERIDALSLRSILTLEPEDINPIAHQIDGKLRFGSLTDASIRCHIMDGRPGDESLGEDPKLFYYIRHKLSDWGVVIDGSNPAAMKTRSSSIEDFIKSRTTRIEFDHLSLAKAIRTKYYIF